MVRRITERDAFVALSRARRVRRGPLSVAWHRAGGPADPPRVAYAVGRRVGNAVVRNRVRRRFRAACREHEQLLLPGVDYLVGAGPAAAGCRYDELAGHLMGALTAIAAPIPERAP